MPQAQNWSKGAVGRPQTSAHAMSAGVPAMPSPGLSSARSLPRIPARNGGPFFPCTTSFRQALVAASAGGSGASLVSGGRRPA
jgi:hypothetical protein